MRFLLALCPVTLGSIAGRLSLAALLLIAASGALLGQMYAFETAAVEQVRRAQVRAAADDAARVAAAFAAEARAGRMAQAAAQTSARAAIAALLTAREPVPPSPLPRPIRPVGALAAVMAALIGALFWLLGRSIRAPLAALVAATERLGAGEFDAGIPYVYRPDEAGDQARALFLLRDRLRRAAPRFGTHAAAAPVAMLPSAAVARAPAEPRATARLAA